MLATRPLTSNLHHDGVTLEDWYSRKQLTDMYRVLRCVVSSITGLISTIEAQEYPFYSVQWRPPLSLNATHMGLLIRHKYTHDPHIGVGVISTREA